MNQCQQCKVTVMGCGCEDVAVTELRVRYGAAWLCHTCAQRAADIEDLFDRYFGPDATNGDLYEIGDAMTFGQHVMDVADAMRNRRVLGPNWKSDMQQKLLNQDFSSEYADRVFTEAQEAIAHPVFWNVIARIRGWV